MWSLQVFHFRIRRPGCLGFINLPFYLKTSSRESTRNCEMVNDRRLVFLYNRSITAACIAILRPSYKSIPRCLKKPSQMEMTGRAQERTNWSRNSVVKSIHND